MLKFLSVTLFLLVSSHSVLSTPVNVEDVQLSYKSVVNPHTDPLTVWGSHILDFVQLIDIEDILGVVINYFHDSEVMNFLSFLLSDEFKEVIWEFESMGEFREALEFLEDKGYEVVELVQLINAAFNLPPFETIKMMPKGGKGLSGLIEDFTSVLPLEEMKELFENKLENSPEVAQLFETINSEEFLDIMKRLAQNPKYFEIKIIFENLGFDFKYLCGLAKEIFGDYYQGVFCE